MHTKENQEQHLSAEQGLALLKLARVTLKNQLRKTKQKLDPETRKLLSQARLENRQGVFVTLQQNQSLRGCIGNLSGDKSILEGVKENTLNAALKDTRFAPVSPQDLDQIRIEISVLSEPKEMEYEEPEDLVQGLRPKVDGVIVQKDWAKATFLPQVWEQLPDPGKFLGQLCRKAGLAADAWKTEKLKVLTYQVQHFQESPA